MRGSKPAHEGVGSFCVMPGPGEARDPGISLRALKHALTMFRLV
jgi:hypothetical protein